LYGPASEAVRALNRVGQTSRNADVGADLEIRGQMFGFSASARLGVSQAVVRLLCHPRSHIYRFNIPKIRRKSRVPIEQETRAAIAPDRNHLRNVIG